MRWPLNYSSMPVVIDGVIHWIAFDTLPRRIISFYLTSEEFSEVELPECLAHSRYPYIFNFKGSLAAY
ncbi:putative F-box associated domain, type 3 [Helianthus anomalus]